jgi:hypothetical protein
MVDVEGQADRTAPHHATQRFHMHDQSRQEQSVQRAGHERDPDRKNDSDDLQVGHSTIVMSVRPGNWRSLGAGHSSVRERDDRARFDQIGSMCESS